MLAGWVKIGLSMIDEIVDTANYALPTEQISSTQNPILPGLQEQQFDRPQGRKTAPAKENIPRIVSVSE